MARYSARYRVVNLHRCEFLEGLIVNTVKETADYIENSLIEAGISLESFLNYINLWNCQPHAIRDELWRRVQKRKQAKKRED